MGLPEIVAAVMLAALVAYALTGGADFGGGIWDLLARGPRAEEHRRLVERALAPVWEANHVWLIFVIVILFTAFPPAFSAMSTALHAPLVLLLMGIVLRGSAFVFRQYGAGAAPAARRWGRVFAIASAAAPFFLGTILAAITQGIPLLDPELALAAPSWVWTSPFSLLVGGFVLSLFAFLAAVYLTVEAEAEPDLAADFRRRALVAGMIVGVFALACGLAARAQAPAFFQRWWGAWWTWPLQIIAALLATGALFALWTARDRLARHLAAAQVAAIVIGWGAGQYPFLIAPDLTIRAAAAPPITLELLIPVLLVGGAVLIPSLFLLIRIFKSTRARERGDTPGS